jgi:hypothetical protein
MNRASSVVQVLVGALASGDRRKNGDYITFMQNLILVPDAAIPDYFPGQIFGDLQPGEDIPKLGLFLKVQPETRSPSSGGEKITENTKEFYLNSQSTNPPLREQRLSSFEWK